MELPRRKPNDVYLPDGEFSRAMQRMREDPRGRDLRIGIVYAFDERTRMLPYWYADNRMAPCSVRTLGDVLHASGFEHVRIVLQQWTPNFRPSEAVLDGKPLDVLMVSAMQVHADRAYDLIREAHNLGDDRPLILVGGPKAIYEPTDYFDLGPGPNVGADASVTGEAPVMLSLLDTILDYRQPGETMRQAFERARRVEAFNDLPGVVYLKAETPTPQPVAVHTGIQRLLRDLDELPIPDAGYRMLEPPHKGTRLREKPLDVSKVRRYSRIASLISTHGCKFNCNYCPIPAVNQRTWRHKSPQRMAAEIKHIYETFGIRNFFGTDDNFFNSRETVIELMTELANTETQGVALGRRIKFYTEATEFDVHKNQDILPLCRKGGLRGIWFGLEDVTADLVNKGQTAGKTEQLFNRLHEIGIMPMVMMIHSDQQPLRSDKDDLAGVIDQARYLFDKGAVSYQCTYLGPAVGTRSFDDAVQTGTMYDTVGGKPIPQAFFDGNHIVASEHPRPWERQINLLRAYASFYNPVNTVRSLFKIKKDSVSWKRFFFQFIGQIGLVITAPKLYGWARRLKREPITLLKGVPPLRIPMVDAHTGLPMNWAIDHPLPPSHGVQLMPPHVSKPLEPADQGAFSLPVVQPPA